MRKIKLSLAVGFGVVVLWLVWWFCFRIPGPDEVAQMTAQAISRKDVDTLLNLTLPEERTKLHITAEAVRGILGQTVYLHGLPGKLAVKRVQDSLVDQFQYDLTPADGNTHGLHYPWPIMITQRPDGRWYLPLAYMMLTSCKLPAQDQETGEISGRYLQLSDQYGVLGIRLNPRGYEYNHPQANASPNTSGTAQ